MSVFDSQPGAAARRRPVTPTPQQALASPVFTAGDADFLEQLWSQMSFCPLSRALDSATVTFRNGSGDYRTFVAQLLAIVPAYDPKKTANDYGKNREMMVFYFVSLCSQYWQQRMREVDGKLEFEDVIVDRLHLADGQGCWTEEGFRRRYSLMTQHPSNHPVTQLLRELDTYARVTALVFKNDKLPQFFGAYDAWVSEQGA